MRLRRVVGDSMLPSLTPGQIVVGIRSRNPKVGSLVIVEQGQREIVKRLAKVSENKLYIEGDNPASSTDSRQYGWIARDKLLATVIWPKA